MTTNEIHENVLNVQTMCWIHFHTHQRLMTTHLYRSSKSKIVHYFRTNVLLSNIYPSFTSIFSSLVSRLSILPDRSHRWKTRSSTVTPSARTATSVYSLHIVTYLCVGALAEGIVIVCALKCFCSRLVL